jgi:hypothetical protein
MPFTAGRCGGDGEGLPSLPIAVHAGAADSYCGVSAFDVAQQG